MYREAPDRLPSDTIDHFLALAQKLDTSPGGSGSRFTDYKQTEELFGKALWELLPGRFRNHHRCTIIALYPSQQIVAHRDPPLPIGDLRAHIPLQVNEGCWVFHDGTWQQLEVGKIYVMDPKLEHGAVNWGHTIRFHLMTEP